MSVWAAARNLLVVRLDNAGDVVMLGPTLRAIKETSPTSRVTLLATRAGAAVVPWLPWIDDVIVWRPVWQELGVVQQDPVREQQLISSLGERRFDGAIIFTSFRQDPHVPGYVCFLAGIPSRAGQSKEFGGATLTDEFPSPPDDLHQTERNLALVERLGFTVGDRRLHLELTTADRDGADRLLIGADIRPPEPFVVFHPGASAPARRYRIDRGIELAERLVARGIRIVVTGGVRERDVLQQFADRGFPVVTGATFGEFAAVIERASAVVCGNTLPLHLCDALGTSVVALYSGSDLESQWRPRFVTHRLLRRETACHPCYLIDCPIGQPCLDLSPDSVADEVISLVAETETRTARQESAASGGRR